MSEIAAQLEAAAGLELTRTFRSRHSRNVSEDLSACMGGASSTNCPAGHKSSDLGALLTTALVVGCEDRRCRRNKCETDARVARRPTGGAASVARGIGRLDAKEDAEVSKETRARGNSGRDVT
jgi:hypothetical protein